MKTITDKFYQFSSRFVEFLTLALVCILFAGSFLVTCYADDMTTQVVLTRWDNPLVSVLSMILFIVVLLCAASLICRNAQRWRPVLLFLTLSWILLLGCILILFSKSVPAADAMSVYSAAEMLAVGDTSVIHPTESYFSYYPQQVGLMAFLEVLFRIWNLFGIDMPAYHFIKGFYVLMLCAAVFFQYKSVHLLWEDDKIDCIYLLLAASNLPMIMYSSFIYGEIPSFTAFSVGLCYLLKMMKSSERKQTVNAGGLSLLFLTLSVLLRKNTLILIIAVLLVTGLQWLKTGRHGLVLFTVLCMVFSLSVLPAVQKIYEYRAGNTLRSGVTAMSYLAMGMQEAPRANGWYNGFNFNTYQESGMNSAIANGISHQAIQERLTYFRENPIYAVTFYTGKHLSQWADGTYASRQATLAQFGGRHALFQSLYEGDFSNLYISWCNLYQNTLYFGALLFCLGNGFSKGLRTAKNKKEKDSPLSGLPIYIGFIGVLGGFLFHIFWEANSRYIFVYGLLLMPYAAWGLSQFGCRLYALYQKHRGF